MFQTHTRFTQIACWIMAINCVIGAVTIAVFIPTLSIDGSTPNADFIHIGLLTGLLITNSYICYRTMKKSLLALKVCMGLYTLQTFGIESEQLNVYFNAGLQLTLSWSFELFSLSINFASLFILLFLYKGLKSLKFTTSTAVHQ